MQIFQEEQLNNNKIKAEMLDFLIILFTFASAILKFVLYFLNLQSGSGQIAIVYVIVAVISAFLCFKYFSIMIPKGFFAIFVLFLLIGFSFSITWVRFGSTEPKFISECKAYFAMAICTLMITYLISRRRKRDINLNVIFVAIIMLSLISFLSLFQGDSITSGGYISDSSGLIYQNVSYFSAHAFGLTLFHITESRKYKSLSWIYKLSCFVLLIIQTSSCLLSGGRGGLVLLFVLFISCIIFNFGKKAYKIIVPVVIFIIIIRFTVPWLINLLGINIKGFTRIMSFLSGDLKTDSRVGTYMQSFDLFRESPIAGNGIGSIFNYLNSYSHNMVLDILAETGVVGLLVFVFVFVLCVRKNYALFRQGSLFRFLTYIFICGITFNMFSGYVWTNQLVWLPAAVFLAFNPNESVYDRIETTYSNDDIQDDAQDNIQSLTDNNNG